MTPAGHAPGESWTPVPLARGAHGAVVAPHHLATAAGSAILRSGGSAVDAAIGANPDVADKIRAGKHAAAGALIGAVMKEMRGQADAARVRELVLEKLT